MTTDADLMERVKLFRMMQLPGQMQMMHMGTAYLVDDLARAVRTTEIDRELWRTRTEKAEAELLTVLQREAATTARHDARVDKLEADRDAWRIRAEQAESRVAALETMVAELEASLAARARSKPIRLMTDAERRAAGLDPNGGFDGPTGAD